MSECNYCRWQWYKKKGYRMATAKDRKQWDESSSEEEFVDAFGPGVVIVDKEGEFVAWFMELPNRCCC